MNKRREEGYTLMEITVVILIIGILFSLAVISYTGVRNSGFDTEAKTNLHSGVTAAHVYYTDHDSSYKNMSAVELAEVAKGVNFRDGDVNSNNDVYVSNTTDNGFILSCRSASGIVFQATGTGLNILYNY
ncbi:MAG: type II secretion system protein [Actinomycetota bacterium]